MLNKNTRLASEMTRRSFLLQSVAAVALSFSSLCAAFPVAAPRRSRMSMVSSTAIPHYPVHTTVEQHSVRPNLLPLEEGSHNSAKIVVTPDLDRTNFRARLEATVASCRSQQKSSLWVEVPMSCAGLIEEMTDVGLTFHHAKGNVASLNLWLKDSENKIPEYATHHVGVGAVVVNSRNEILVVREKRRNYRPWKIPGGLSDLGEDIPEAAIREVMEETGVPCRFLSIVSFRHTHNLALGRSDLYFVCRLEPIEEQDDEGNAIIPVPVACEEEIEKVEWLPIDEYRAMVDGEGGENPHPMMQHIMKLHDQEWKGHDIQQTVLSSIVPGRQPSPIYHPPLRGQSTD